MQNTKENAYYEGEVEVIETSQIKNKYQIVSVFFLFFLLPLKPVNAVVPPIIVFEYQQ